MFSEKDLQQIATLGADVKTVQSQIEHFKKGFDFMNLEKAATPQSGVLVMNDAQVQSYVNQFDAQKNQFQILKFVPASGAASRMFKSLFAAIEEDKQDKSVQEFGQKLNQFAFAEELKSLNAENDEIKGLIENLLLDKGLGYGILPKGLLSFHKYENGSRTPLEEHLVEGAMYAESNGVVNLHLTVSPEHKPKFEALVQQKLGEYESKFGVKFNISYSIQKPSTDTIAVDMSNEPFRENDGKLLFRPAGHGALIANLNDVNADIIFIKNIDNVVPDRLKETTVIYKKALAGLLVETQNQIFDYLKTLQNHPTESEVQTIKNYVETALCHSLAPNFEAKSEAEKTQILAYVLNRPLRVCGMVRNAGEPGGGPFWCKNENGSTSLQIVESAQVNFGDEAQKAIFAGSTHFNPVDLVCATKDYMGQKFNLTAFVDTQAGFITEKSKDGKALKAMELPGLWNGSMSHWNSIFVEVPSITFNPVKTINDLLREEHQ